MTTPTPHAQSIYMREMMEHLGIEPGGGTISRLGLSYAAAFHRREACPSKQACREWLDRMPAAVAGAARDVVGIWRGAISGNMKLSFQAARSIG